jgi:hypothetical protein
MVFIARKVKASWGLPCNQDSNGELWAGKGFEKRLSGQFGKKVEADLSKAIAGLRGNRYGRFWVDLETRKVTMAVGQSADNQYDETTF